MVPPASAPSSPGWGRNRELVALALVGLAWAGGLALRMVEFESTSLDQAAIHPHFYAELMARGEPWPFVGPPAAFFLRHGAVNAWILASLQPLCDSLADSTRVAAVLRSLAIPLLYLLGRRLGAPALGLAAACVRAVAPETVNLDRHFGGTYFLDVVLLGAMWGIAAGPSASTVRLAATAAAVACLPLVHPMGLPAALGLGAAGLMLLRTRSRRDRAIVLAAAAVPLLPYLGVEVASHFGGLRSVLAMVTGGVEFEAPGDDGVGFLWTVRLLLKDPAPLPLSLPATLAFVGSPLLLAWWGLRPTDRSRLGVPGFGYALGAAALLVMLTAVQGGVGYGYGHHVMSAFLLGFAVLAAAWGQGAARRFGPIGAPVRLRAEAALAVVLALLLLPLVPRIAADSAGAAFSWPDGMVSVGSTTAMAALIEAERTPGPLHLALVHAPGKEYEPPVALSAVVLELLHRGLPLGDLPQYPPAGAVQGFLILVGRGDGRIPPGRELPFVDPHPDAARMPVRVWWADDYMELKAWAEALPEGWELFGTEEYQDLFEYYSSRPVWPGRGGALPVLDSPFRSSDW